MNDWTHWINLGVPMVILVAVGWCLYKIGMFVGHKLFDDDKGLVVVWVDGEQKWRNTLTERLEAQGNVCIQHASHLKGMADILEEQKVVSVASEKSLATSNMHLSRLVELHDPRGSIGTAAAQISSNSDSLNDLKSIWGHCCDLLEEIAKKQIPDSAPAVTMHCTRIRELIGKT